MTFNPHGNKTANGVVITEGLRVLDYNRREGTVVADRDATRYMCPAVDGSTADPETPGCRHDHWFDVKPDEGQDGGGMFNGDRLKAI
jgi:hypothetical protein